MERFLIILIVLTSLTNLVEKCDGLFEYICEESQLFRPYLHVYRGRKGERVIEVGPGFHVMTSEQDIYVCVNGPAYLYFARTTELGQVYEAPQPHVYSHTCEMYNVKPHSKATKLEYELHLMAVLLYGDPEDYRRPAIQRFTAPYFFKEDDYFKGFMKHYQNATSIAVLGQSECSLEKGDKNPKIPIKIRPKWPAATPPTPPPPSGDKPELDQYLCRLGFSELMKEGDGKPDADPEKQKMRVMVNDEPIRVKRCEPSYKFDAAEFNKTSKSLEDRVNATDKKWTDTPVADRKTKMNDTIEKAIKPWQDKIKILEDKKNTSHVPPPSAAEIARLEAKIKKIQEERIDPEKAKQAPYDTLVDETDKEVSGIKPFAAPADADAKSTKEAVDKAEEAVKKAEEAVPATKPEDLNKLKDALYEAQTKAYEKAEELSLKLSEIEMKIAKAEAKVGKVESQISNYKPTPGGATKKKPTSITYTERSEPQIIDIDATKNAKACEKLPRLKGDDGECTKGKPKGEDACNLFKVTLGKTKLWEEPPGSGTATKDAWKKDILDLTSDIFVNACPYLPNRRKFVKLVNLALGYYVTSKNHFNKVAPVGTSMSCVAFHDWQKGISPPSTPTQPDAESHKLQRPFWTTIISVLKECKEAKRSLIFEDKSPTYGRWVWIKPGKNRTEKRIEPYREQAEKEYVFNWVIDMAWRIFATALGMCMPGYEKKIPLITSRFYSFFTEDFLIPLRETWVNAKDNLIYQWILGEFYNGDAENWAEMCMEASYFYSEREDYRPLRSLLVNCASEHNYFITGKYVGYTGRYVGSG